MSGGWWGGGVHSALRGGSGSTDMAVCLIGWLNFVQLLVTLLVPCWYYY
jgi:hypothetical protein